MLEVCREVGERGQAGEPNVGRDIILDNAEGGDEVPYNGNQVPDDGV
jgi:hypothetical protein